MSRRVYCWRVGHAFTALDDGRCPECGRTDHESIEHCGAYAGCRETSRRECLDDGGRITGYVVDYDHGHPCELDAGHDGAHACVEAQKECHG